MSAQVIRSEIETTFVARPRRSSLLRHVSIVTVPVTLPPGSFLPLLVQPDSSICLELYEFFRAPAYRGRSGSWRRHHAMAVALLYDHRAASPDARAGGGREAEAIADFAECLLVGTISADGRDPSGLFWPAHSRQQSYAVLLAVRTFCRFILERSPRIEADGASGRRFSARQWLADQAKSANSLLGHLDDRDTWGRERPMALPFERQLSTGRRTGRPLPFPSSLEVPLLSTALMPAGPASREQRGIAIRNALLFLLLLYGGLRKSEALQLFLQDIAPDPEGQGTTVFLYHPEDGGVPGSRMRRAEYLAFHHRLVPRTRYDVTDGRWSGWKSVLLDEAAPERCQRSRVYWRNKDAGLLFWALHCVYVNEIRPKDAPNPYYLTSLAGPYRGMPMTLAAIDQAFATGLARLGLRQDASMGLSPHCMRHAYGQALSNAGVKPEALQVCLHQTNPASQLVYTRPFPVAISEELARAERRIAERAGGVDLTALDLTALDLNALGVRPRSDPIGIFSAVAPLVRDETVRRVALLNGLHKKETKA